MHGSEIAFDQLALVAQELRPAVPDLLSRPPAVKASDSIVAGSAEANAVLALMKDSWVLNTNYIPQSARSVPVRQHIIHCSATETDVPLYIVGEKAAAPQPAILHMHGGGFVIGRAADYVPVLQAIASALNCMLVSVDYSLSPEVTFPTPMLQAYSALAWLHESAQALGIDRNRIAIQGESAGGGLAAMLAMYARNRAEYSICFQMLTHPMLDDRTGSSTEVPEHIGSIGWNRNYNKIGWSAFLGQPAGMDEVPNGSVPAREADLSNLPPSLIWVGSIDLFVAENMQYANRLVEAGVPTEFHLIPGVYHSFLAAAPGSSITRNYWQVLLEAYAASFDRSLKAQYLSLFEPG